MRKRFHQSVSTTTQGSVLRVFRAYNFGPDERHVAMLHQLVDHIVQNGARRVREILFESAQPTDVHVRVRQDNDLIRPVRRQ